MAQRRPEFEGKPIPAVPAKKLPPDAPSAEKLADRAREIKDRPRKAKKTPVESKEDLSNQIKLAEHFQLAETMARDTVDILDVGMSHMDDVYDPEIQWVLKKRHEKLSFKFTKTEGETVGNACFSLYKKVDPSRLAAIGGWCTGLALVAVVLLPRLKLASELGRLREDLAEETKKQSERSRAPAPPASDSRTPGAQAPIGLGVGGNNK